VRAAHLERVLRDLRPLLADLPDAVGHRDRDGPQRGRRWTGADPAPDLRAGLRRAAPDRRPGHRTAGRPAAQRCEQHAGGAAYRAVFRPDRAALADYGLTVGQVGQVVRASIAGTVAGVLPRRSRPGARHPRAPGEDARAGCAGRRHPGPRPRGTVPISSLGIIEAESPTAIQRVDRARTVEIDAQIGQGTLTDGRRGDRGAHGAGAAAARATSGASPASSSSSAMRSAPCSSRSSSPSR
jgi:hypothetical protein